MLVEYVEFLFHKALRAEASDIHFEYDQAHFRIRFKVHGVFRTHIEPDIILAPMFSARIKVLANLDINERRLPQDGQFLFEAESQQPIVMRVSVIPTYQGETIALRLLNPSMIGRSMEALGMPESIIQTLNHLIRCPNGLIVISGATGSGKTTTLYALLQKLNQPNRKLITIEDPVEYTLEGSVQMNVESTLGLTFEACLRSCLRQDPDIIAIGEIRDMVSAKAAVQAALTGHLVLTTLHTGSPSEAVVRLLQLGIQPQLLSAVLKGIVHQAWTIPLSTDIGKFTETRSVSIDFQCVQGAALKQLILPQD